MSKCKAVLDGEKITEIQVKIKAQEKPRKGKPESGDSSLTKRVTSATP